QPVRDSYEAQGHPYYATARLWDDGIVTPGQTRDVVAMAMSAALNAPVADSGWPVFRM
ncbi:MAG: methylcrotonoyl-CoA carboxylase, partial [Planctomycetes bacterium]|nr:methylcrotonoyl-CoA carboxylase [Planctomycetota bacterium]